MRNEITIKIDTCQKCQHFVKKNTWDAPKCGRNQFYIPLILTGPGIDIPSWCPILLQSQWDNNLWATANRESANRLVEILCPEEKASSEQQNEEARNIELD